jgi:prepilin-type N-terminal cleavage/methylation domain-containing protein
MMPRRDGFTLIELLVAMLLIAILATMGLTRFWSVKDRSILTTMQSDLRNLATEQEAYFQRNYQYAGLLSDIPDYSNTPGVTINLTYAAQDGWAGNATHTNLGPTRSCGLFTGNAPAAAGAPATVNGLIACN